MTLRLPASTLASIILAAADGLTYATRIDGDDLFARSSPSSTPA